MDSQAAAHYKGDELFTYIGRLLRYKMDTALAILLYHNNF